MERVGCRHRRTLEKKTGHEKLTDCCPKVRNSSIDSSNNSKLLLGFEFVFLGVIFCYDVGRLDILPKSTKVFLDPTWMSEVRINGL